MLKYIIIIAVLICLPALGALVLFANPDNHKGEYQIKHSNSNQHPTNQSTENSNNGLFQDNKTPKTQTSKINSANRTYHSNDKVNLRAMTYYETFNIFMMILIFIVTAIYAVFAGLQWRIIQTSMRIDQRAWIAFNGINIEFKVGKPVVVIVNFINTGKTPAINLNYITTFEPLDTDTSPDFSKENNIITEYKGLATPRQEFQIVVKPPENILLTDIGYTNVISGTQRLYIHGRIRYTDIFGYPHWITYCYYLDRDLKRWHAHKEHNDIDRS